jgi:Kdo2-lipid IVA lauroyltransferase/acyltransferase
MPTLIGSCMGFIITALGKLPLRMNHVVGAVIGWLAWIFSARHRRITRENLAQFCVSTNTLLSRSLLNSAIAHQGRAISELAIAWTAPVAHLYALVRECEGWEHVDTAKKANRAVIFVTPHLGCFDIAGRYVESRIPVTALYRPPKQKWLEPIMQRGRIRGGGSTAPADAQGVRTLLKTLKQGGNIVILPDQVPVADESSSSGVWADFFAKPAYTMTLLPRLALSNKANRNAAVLFFYAERLPKGKGFRIKILPMSADFSSDKHLAARETNAMVEQLICRAPAQYLWGYNRYKRPAGAPPPPS